MYLGVHESSVEQLESLHGRRGRPQVQQIVQLLHLLAVAPAHAHHEGCQQLCAVQNAVPQVPQERLIVRTHTHNHIYK